MKCLIILDPSTASALYIEHSAEIENVLVPQVQSIINFISGTIGQRPQFISAGKLKFVFQYNDYINSNSQKSSDLLWFVLVSDDEDSETLLRNRLTLLNHLYSMVLGNQLIDRKNGAKLNMRKLKEKMSSISATVNALFDESQSVLCQAFEFLELNDRIRTRILNCLTDIFNEFPQASYAAIYVGQKLVTFHCRQKPHLQNFDLFLLSIYCQIQLKPRERVCFKKTFGFEEEEVGEEQTTPISIAQEISSFENISPRNDISLDSNHGFNSPPAQCDDGLSGEDDMFETAPEDFDEPISFLASPFLTQLLDENFDQSTTTTTTNLSKSKRYKLSILTESLKEGVKSTSPPESISVLNYSLLFIGYLEESLSKDTFTSNTESAIKKFQFDNHLPETGEADFNTIKSILWKVKNSPTLITKTKKFTSIDDNLSNISSLKDISLGSRKDDSIDSNHSKTSTTSTTTTNNNNNNNNNVNLGQTFINMMNSGNIPEPTKGWVAAPSTLETIYFRSSNQNTTPIWAYCAEIQENTFLLLLNKEKVKKDTKEEIEHLEQSKRILFERICKQYGPFLLVKEKSNIAISRFSHIPGLVHFIFINRSNHSIKAPTITQLNGPKNTLGVAPEDMVALIKKRVWSMYSHCCHQLKKGYSYQIIKDKDFQYSYRLWVEDDERQEQTAERDTRISSSRSIYDELSKRYYPHPVKCLELLTLYIGSLPVSLIYKNDRVLCSLLFDKEQE